MVNAAAVALPARLKQQLDANDAAVVAQRQSATNQEQNTNG